jgi:hypothetical protein
MRRTLIVASLLVAYPLAAQQPARWLATRAPSQFAAPPKPGLDTVSAEDLIYGYQQLINRAHERGLVIFGATMTPMANMTRPTTAAVTPRIRGRVRLHLRTRVVLLGLALLPVTGVAQGAGIRGGEPGRGVAGGRPAPKGPLLANPEEFRPAVATIDAGGKCRTITGLPLPYKQTMVQLNFGTAPNVTRRVQIQFDSTGAPWYYTDYRGDIADLNRTSPAGRRTIIAFGLSRGGGYLLNSGGGKPSEVFSVRTPAALNAVSLGVPSKMIARVVRECGTGR